MNCVKLKDHGSPRLLLLFSGWGVDEGVFADVSVEGYDVVGVSDYSDDRFAMELLEGYDEIVAICWSYGVYMGARFLASHPQLPVTLKVAVNGTLAPVDDHYGIPEAIFDGTLQGLSEATYAKFLRRTAGRAYPPSNRPIESLKAELARIASTSRKEQPASAFRFDRAVVALSDRIIPAANQCAAWEASGVDVTTIEGGHLPDFPQLVGSLVVNKKRVGERFLRSKATYARNALAQKEIAQELAVKIGSLGREVIEIGVGRGFLTEAVLTQYAHPERLTLVDLLACELPAGADPSRSTLVEADAESWLMQQADQSCDAIISSSTMQWFNSPATFLRQCSRVVRRDGTVAIATFGPDTYRELEGLAPRLQMTAVEALKRWAEEAFEEVEVSTATLSLNFDEPSEALRHIRLTGVNAVADNAPVASALRLARHYPRLADGRCSLTYQPVYLLLKKPKYV